MTTVGHLLAGRSTSRECPQEANYVNANDYSGAGQYLRKPQQRRRVLHSPGFRASYSAGFRRFFGSRTTENPINYSTSPGEAVDLQNVQRGDQEQRNRGREYDAKAQ